MVGQALPGLTSLWTPPSQAPTRLWGTTALTGVDLLVAAHAVGVHDALEAGREAGGADECGGHVPGGDAVNHGTHTCLTLGHPAGRPADRQTEEAQAGPTETLGPPQPGPDGGVEGASWAGAQGRAAPRSLRCVHMTATPGGRATAPLSQMRSLRIPPGGPRSGDQWLRSLDLNLSTHLTPSAAARVTVHPRGSGKSGVGLPGQGQEGLGEGGPGKGMGSALGGGNQGPPRGRGGREAPPGSPSCPAAPAAGWAGRAWHTRPQR